MLFLMLIHLGFQILSSDLDTAPARVLGVSAFKQTENA